MLGVAIAPALVASTAEAALVVEGGVVYPAGVLVRVGARLRRAISQTDNYIAPQFHWHWPPHPPDAGFIDVGVRFVDGTELRNSDNTLLSLSGAGSALSAWHDLWAPGAPLDGTVELWTRWIGAGIAETRTRLELTAARTGPTPIW